MTPMAAISPLLKLNAYIHISNHKIQKILSKCSFDKINSRYSESVDETDQEPERIELFITNIS